MTRASHPRLPTEFGIVLSGVVLASLAFVSAAAPTTTAARRTVTLTLRGTGKGVWQTDKADEKSTQQLKYDWHGTLSFKVPSSKITDPRHKGLAAISAKGRLVANWTGALRGTKVEEPYAGPIDCSYAGKSVAISVRGILQARPSKRTSTLFLTLHPAGRASFFPNHGVGATVRCASYWGSQGPSHFEPEWLFRDTLTDHGFYSENTAVLALPGAMLPAGSATLTFPKEKGQNTSPGIGDLTWNNKGKVVVRARG